MICHIDELKVDEIGKVIQDAINKSIVEKLESLVRIESLSGKCYFQTRYLMGFYFRPATKTANEEFQTRLLELAKRQTDAAEKIVGDCDHGEDWKQ